MALYEKVQKSDDEDEDLEALRLAALQTLGSKPSVAAANTRNVTKKLQQPMHHQPTGPGRGFRGGVHRMHSTRNQVFQRHRQNSNLIAIVPVNNEPSPDKDFSAKVKMGRGRGMVNDSGVKLELPQDRYCKVDSTQENKTDAPVVSTKFSRYDDSNSDSSAEESEGEEDGSGKMSASGGEEDEDDHDVLTVEEDSLDKLMDELEEEMNRSETNVPVSNTVKQKTESKKRNKSSGSKSKHKSCDTSKKQKSQGVPTTKTVPASSNKDRKIKDTQNHKKEPSLRSSVSPPHISVSSHPVNHKDKVSVEKEKSYKPNEISQKSELPPKSVNSSQKQFSPILSRKSRSRSRSRPRSPIMKRRSRSLSPRNRYNYSPVRSRMPRSPRSKLSRSPVPRGKLSRSPIRLAKAKSRSRSRSRSPLRPLRSPPRKRYSRSPPSWHPPTGHVSRFSPQRLSPRSKRPLSPRRSPSPRVNRSPRRTPESRWWPSPRRSLSPVRRSPSPPPRLMSPRPRRLSVSPRRPLSPVRRRLSPSPLRRNPSPARRFSPRRNPSSPRARYSRSLSRSPERFISRVRSPIGGRSLHHGTPLSPKRRASRSPSPRRRLSRSPFNRLPPRHSPVGRRLSPWSPPKQNLGQRISPGPRRYSKSPGGKQKSLSPYSRQRKRSLSPNRRLPVSRPPVRPQRSPVRDGRRLPQESRANNSRPRSRSPLPSRHPDLDHRSRSPVRPRSPRRSRSPTSSISLSPSPDRGTANSSHRYKSPLRLHSTDYRNAPPVLNVTKENINNNRQRNVSPVQGARIESVSTAKPLKSRPNKQKESKNRGQKRERSKEDNRKDYDSKYKESTSEKNMPSDSSSKTNKDQSESLITNSKLAILEARRLKFESTGPVKPYNKKIRLKTSEPSHPSPQQSTKKEENLIEENETSQEEKNMDSIKEEEATAILTEKSASTIDDSDLLETGDDFDFDLDEPFIELQGGDLWSSEESDSDNEGRFKSGGNVQGSDSSKVTVLPFTKLLGESKTSSRIGQANSKHKKPDTSRKVSSGEHIKEEPKPKKATMKITGVSKLQTENPQDAGKKTTKLPIEEEKFKLDSKICNPTAKTSEVESVVKVVEDENEEQPVRNKEGDLRAELSRRRAERLTKAGSLHESLPARLLQNAFEGVVGKKSLKRVDKEEKQPSGKHIEPKKEKSDGRRVLVLKRPSVIEQRIPSISVTIPKERKRDMDPESPPAKLPIRMRLGLPSGGSSPEDRHVPRRRNRKVKLKRNVMLGSRPDDKV